VKESDQGHGQKDDIAVDQSQNFKSLSGRKEQAADENGRED